MKIKFDFPFYCILLSLAFQTAAAFFVKMAATTIEEFSIFTTLTNPYYLAMLVSLVLHALSWQIALRKYPLAFAYFIMSLLPVSTLLISHFVFDEQVTSGNIAGCILIVMGLIVFTRKEKAAVNV